jgi:hypothetical protein
MVCALTQIFLQIPLQGVLSHRLPRTYSTTVTILFANYLAQLLRNAHNAETAILSVKFQRAAIVASDLYFIQLTFYQS